MDKCATIYRRETAAFIFVCYHCENTFPDIDGTLKHIKSHFQLVEVTIDENHLKPEWKDIKTSIDNDLDIDNICDVTDSQLDIKEVMESVEDGSELLGTPLILDCQLCDSKFISKFSFRCHQFRKHSNQQALECEK